MKVAVINLITRTPLVHNEVPQVKSNRDNIIVKFAKALRKQGIDLDLFVSDAYKPIVKETLDVKVIYVRTLWKFIFWPSRLPFVPALFAKLRNKYDIVVCTEAFQWGTVFAVLSKLFSFKRKTKVIVWQETSRHQQLFKKLPSLIFHKLILKFFLDKHIAKYIPWSEPSKQFLIKQGIKKNKITCSISHGFDQNVFFYDSNIEKDNYIFSPSRLIDFKGVDILLKAFAIVKEKLNNIKLLIQGEGPNLEEYKALSSRLKINKKVKFDIVRIDHNEMRIRYNKALVTIIATKRELCNISVLESIACGTPVIVSTGADNHIAFLDGRGGMVFNSGDYNELANAIVKIIKDDTYRNSMGKWALEKSKLYSHDYLCKFFVDIICDIYNDNNPVGR